MPNYTLKELSSLSSVFLKSQYFAHSLFSEVGKSKKMEIEGKAADLITRLKIRFLSDVYLGYMSEVLNYFKIKKDNLLFAKLESSSTLRTKLEKFRNSAFHITNLNLETKRFKEFTNLANDPSLFKDFLTIGWYIHSVHQQIASDSAERFQNQWAEMSPFDISKNYVVFKKSNLGM